MRKEILLIAGLALIVSLVACEKKPKTKYEYIQQQQEEEEKEKKEVLKKLEGQRVYLVDYTKSKSTSTPLIGDEYRVLLPVRGPFHLREDCPEYKKDLELYKKAISATVKNGKIVDNEGFYHDRYKCSRCVP